MGVSFAPVGDIGRCNQPGTPASVCPNAMRSRTSDGQPEFTISVPKADAGVIPDAGVAFVIDGATGVRLDTLRSLRAAGRVAFRLLQLQPAGDRRRGRQRRPARPLPARDRTDASVPGPGAGLRLQRQQPGESPHLDAERPHAGQVRELRHLIGGDRRRRARGGRPRFAQRDNDRRIRVAGRRREHRQRRQRRAHRQPAHRSGASDDCRPRSAGGQWVWPGARADGRHERRRNARLRRGRSGLRHVQSRPHLPLHERRFTASAHFLRRLPLSSKGTTGTRRPRPRFSRAGRSRSRPAGRA